jgi:hypothetical protein
VRGEGNSKKSASAGNNNAVGLRGFSHLQRSISVAWLSNWRITR